MSAVRAGSSSVKLFAVGNETVFPLWFTGGFHVADGASSGGRPAEMDALWTTIGLAAASGVRLISVEVTMGAFLRAGHALVPSAVAMLRRTRALAPRAFMVLRVTFYGGVANASTPDIMQLQSADHPTWEPLPVGCENLDVPRTCASPTARWAALAGGWLKEILSAADAVVPGMIAGVQLGGLSSFEWMLPHGGNIPTGYYPDYSRAMVAEWCAERGLPAGARRRAGRRHSPRSRASRSSTARQRTRRRRTLWRGRDRVSDEVR